MRKANLGYAYRWHAGRCLMAAISLSAVLSVPLGAGAQVVNSTKNPNQIGILRWYGANQTTQFLRGKLPQWCGF